MPAAVVKGKLPASFIPVEFSFPAHQRRTSSTSTSSLSSLSQSARTRDLVDSLEPSYRYLLRPGRQAPAHTSKTATSPTSTSSQSLITSGLTIATDTLLDANESKERRVRRKGKAYRSPPLEPTLSPLDSATDSSTLMSKAGSSKASYTTPGIVGEPLAYIGTINYEFILRACQTLSGHETSSSKSPPRNGESSNHKSSVKTGKRKTSAAKASAGIWDWKGKGNTRSAKELPAKAKKVVPAQRTRQPSEEPRARSIRHVRASSQRPQRTKSTETANTSQRASLAPTGIPLTRNNSTAKGTDDSSGKGSTSLVPPPNGNHQAHILAPPSPLRQSAVPVRLTEKSAGKNAEGGALDAPMTRSASHDVGVPATRGSKRRQSSAGPTFEGGEDEDDVAKRLRRALTASIPHANPASLAPASPKRSSRASRPATRYATRSAPNSPPQESSELFDTPAAEGNPAHPAVNRVGRVLRRTLSHDALPEGLDSGLDDARTRDMAVSKNLEGHQRGIAA